MHTVVRLALIFVCLSALVGLTIHYGGSYDENWPHPTGDQLEENVDEHVGEQVLLFGEVTDNNGDELALQVTNSEDEVVLELEVDGVDESVEEGGVVQVYGVLEADRTMTPSEVVVVDSSQNATRYKYAISLLGGLLAAGYFLYYWRINIREFGFEPQREVADDG